MDALLPQRPRQWFPKIYSWWDLFLGVGDDTNEGLNIIPIGEE